MSNQAVEIILYIPHILIDGWSFNVIYRGV